MTRTIKSRLAAPAKASPVEFVPVVTRPLVTLDHEHSAWSDNAPIVVPDGALVRIIPPSDALPSAIAGFVARLPKTIAGHRVRPRAAMDDVIPDDEHGQAVLATSATATPREIARALIERINVGDEVRRSVALVVEDALALAEQKRPPPASTGRIESGFISGIRLDNWMCFPGVQELALEPTVYSITASADYDADRSNWLGKTSLLNAIRFALTGKYPTRLADGWLHSGARSGGVDLEFSSGVFISRRKEKGAAVTVEVQHSGDQVLTGDAADAWIAMALIDDETLGKVAYLEQKKTDRLISMGPSDRSSMVNEWLDIAWLEDAAETVRRRLDTASAGEAAIRQQLAGYHEFHQGRPKELLAEHEALVPGLQAAFEAATLARAETAKSNEPRAFWEGQKKKHDRYAMLELRLSEPALVAKPPEQVTALLTERTDAALAYNDAKRDADQVRQGVRGEFTGVCPVAGIACPAKDIINNAGVEARNRLTLLDAAVSTALTAKQQVDARAQQAAVEEQQYHKDARERAMCESEMPGLKPAYDYIVANPVAPEWDQATALAALEAATEAKDQAEVALTTAQAYVIRLREVMRLEALALNELTGQAAKVQVLRAALTVLGRNGVQREIAESSLAAIEREGNAAIAGAGIELEFRIMWDRETRKLADACESCGAAFPASAKVKECTRCGATRGKKLSSNLTIELSDRSGGADDLAGVMFQLSAADWLRRARGIGWSIFLIDEPFGSLDRAHVRRLSVHLGKLLGQQFGASQAFVVAHDTDVLESTAGRIHLQSSSPRNTKVQVIGQLEGK